jgi:hypothetical protein
MLDFKVRKGESMYYLCMDITVKAKSLNGLPTDLIVGKIENSVGNCCGMSMLGSLTSYNMGPNQPFFWNVPENVDEVIKFLKAQWENVRLFRDEDGEALSMFVVGGFHVILSRETQMYDQALRNHPNIKLVQQFMNRKSAGGGFIGNELSLYFMEF